MLIRWNKTNRSLYFKNVKQGAHIHHPTAWPNLKHAHSQITQAVAAMDCCFALIRSHKHGIAVGSMTGGTRVSSLRKQPSFRDATSENTAEHWRFTQSGHGNKSIHLAVPLNGFFDSIPFAILAKQGECGSLIAFGGKLLVDVFSVRISVLVQWRRTTLFSAFFVNQNILLFIKTCFCRAGLRQH